MAITTRGCPDEPIRLRFALWVTNGQDSVITARVEFRVSTRPLTLFAASSLDVPHYCGELCVYSLSNSTARRRCQFFLPKALTLFLTIYIKDAS
jgi:hypothetical protein